MDLMILMLPLVLFPWAKRYKNGSHKNAAHIIRTHHQQGQLTLQVITIIKRSAWA